MISDYAFDMALNYGRPETIKKLFPNSRALIVSGKYIDMAARVKPGSMIMAVNGRNPLVIRGALLAANAIGAALIVEIARSEGGANAYCSVNFWNIARIVDAYCNELGIRIPVAIHADHYTIKSKSDIVFAVIEIPTLFEAGITSIAIDASHMPNDLNLLANIELWSYVPLWAGKETEVGEIKGKFGLSTPEEALFLMQGLNAYNIYPDWIALNNGSTHGIEESSGGIDVELTKDIHGALSQAGIIVSGAQHGTSGNDFTRLKKIASTTATTKANVATALQMTSWGLEVDEYGNAILDGNNNFIKKSEKGVQDKLWVEMDEYAKVQKWSPSNYKKLNAPFENAIQAQPIMIRERMAGDVKDLALVMMRDVFNAGDTAGIVIDLINTTGLYAPNELRRCVVDINDWTTERIIEKGMAFDDNKGADGDYDD